VNVAVLGPGGVGGLIGAALARAGEDVTIVARESTARLIAADGISVSSVLLGEFVARPRVVSQLRQPVDVLLVATKATGLGAGLPRIESEPRLVVPLLNGLDHMSLLRQRFGSEVVAAGVIRIEADRVAPARIVHSSPHVRVDLASDDHRLRPALRRLAATLRGARVPAEIGDDEAQILWGKLVRVNALACTTSACDRPIGFIRSDLHWRGELLGCIAEAASAANAAGARIDPARPLAELDNAHPELGSSL
jgi:2-dehydropantoate 2-reductase